MSFRFFLNNVFKMLMYWLIGALIIIIGLVVIYLSMLRSIIGVLIGFGIIGFGVILIWYYTHKHDMDLGPGYKSRPRRFNY